MTIKVTSPLTVSSLPSCVVYFSCEVSYIVGRETYTDTVYGSWERQSGNVGIGLGDYRRAECTLFESTPAGFIDGYYTEDKSCGRDAIPAEAMKDLLFDLLPSIFQLAFHNVA